ncbi:PorP/SprF family type IX secretion system membrane protein [Algibacter lectus]|uniref:Type IX secretion system PorP/SprF family membrane protein n=1 Tax=Algibacter lectus TaxID=221126 RepID=A0A4R8M6V1_9FLAO|nr:PorP/SprF family type IX secretion system membrane protein [Algibacter lectus]MWW25840.1 type IX secretion system membrane protein PorP/SprF [Algibacter lectus]TDY61123.1 type IX secretion system PorP/SprF family membrane protein [Algibacter lectus]
MKKSILHIVLFFSLITQLHSQENGVVAFTLPVRNSLKFNKYALNPTFSFVREQNKYISITNKKQWAQFENAPENYLVSYSGRFSENTGVGIGLFQQSNGVYTNFGGILNFAYNAVFDRDSNLTFGTNVAFYQSGIDQGKIVSNFPDSALNNTEKSSVVTINPGINYGTMFFDFGVSVNNLVSYNLNTSELIEENPEQSIQGHIMYTGFLQGSGFFDSSKFSGLVRSEFKKDQTVISGVMMLTVPKGIWGQAGYNTLYGASAGIGLNISKQIAVEYNYEQSMGELSEFGNSHEITLAYKFNKKYRYNYSDDEEDGSIFSSSNKKRKSVNKRKASAATSESDKERFRANRVASEKVKTERKAQFEAEAKAKEEAKQLAEAPSETEEVADIEEKQAEVEEVTEEVEVDANAEELAKAQQEADAKAKAEELAKAQQAADAKAKAEELARAQQAADAKARAEELAKAQQAADAKAKAEELAKAQQAADAKARAEELAKAQQAADAKARAEELAKAQQAADAKAKAEELAKAQQAADAKARAEEIAKAQQAADAKARAEEIAKAQQAADAKAKAEELAKAQQAADAKARAEELAKADAVAKNQIENSSRAEEIVEAIGNAPMDVATQSMIDLTKLTDESKIIQEDLLSRLNEKMASKQKDLDELKQENDLRDQGIVSAPKPFKSVTAENAALEALKADVENVITNRDEKIKEIEKLYNERRKKVKSKQDPVNVIYLDAIELLYKEQQEAKRAQERLVSTLEDIKIATDIERKRRIKKANYDNEDDRYNKDRAALNYIKESTAVSAEPLTESDFDFGDVQSNIQIVKNVAKAESGYYMVIAVHADEAQRDAFLTKAVAAGQSNIDFFYDVTSSKYFIYSQKFDYIETASRALKNKNNAPYNSKMSMVRIEN